MSIGSKIQYWKEKKKKRKKKRSKENRKKERKKESVREPFPCQTRSNHTDTRILFTVLQSSKQLGKRTS